MDVDLPEYVSRCCSNARALRIIPRGAIICAADALQKLVDRAIREKSPLSWGKLLSYGRCGLKQPPGSPECGGRGVSLTTRVKRQLQDFLESDSLVAPEGDTRRNALRGDGDLKLKRGVSAKFSDGDLKGAVRLLASTEDIAPRDDRTLAQLRQKHPPPLKICPSLRRQMRNTLPPRQQARRISGKPWLPSDPVRRVVRMGSVPVICWRSFPASLARLGRDY
jgi:hypothetical protein